MPPAGALNPSCSAAHGALRNSRVWIRLQAEVDSECLVEFSDERGWQLADPFADPFDRHGADLLGLCFGVMGQPGLACWQQNLERVDARGVRGHRHYRDDPSPEPGCRGVGGVVADDHRGAGLAGFRSAGRVEADGDDLAATHSASQPVGDSRLPGAGII
jgi:hypothetical protein